MTTGEGDGRRIRHQGDEDIHNDSLFLNVGLMYALEISFVNTHLLTRIMGKSFVQ
jgi:hypothetical protein